MKRHGAAVLIATMLGAASCAPAVTSRPVRAADGLAATLVECRQEARCIAESHRLCPGGYFVVDAKASQGYVASRNAAIAPSIYEGQMLIRCQ
jgi:hypothetical protein